MIETILASLLTFVGGAPRAQSDLQETSGFTFMTADEIRSRVARLTGFDYAGFQQFADVIGRYDPTTGMRTNDRPTLITILFMNQAAKQVANAVVVRELFLDDDERIVFRGVDLAVSPSDPALGEFLAQLHAAWLRQPLTAATEGRMQATFREIERQSGSTAAYGAIVASMLEHGGLYYY